MASGAGADERSNGVAEKELDTSGGGSDTYRCDDGDRSCLLPPKKRKWTGKELDTSGGRCEDGDRSDLLLPPKKRKWTGKELDMSGVGSDIYRRDDGDRSRLLPPKKRPRGPGDLLLHGRVHFAPASAAGPSNYRYLYHRHQHSLYNYNPAMSSFPAPNAKVANMMRRMNYKRGSGLGKYGQGIVSPIKAPDRPKHHGLGIVDAEKEGKPKYDNGLPSTDPLTTKWGNGWNRKKRSYQFRYEDLFERGDADGSRKQGREFCEDIHAKVSQRWEAAVARQDQETPELVSEASISEAVAVIHEKSATGELAASELIWEFTWLKERLPEAYKIYGVADAAGVVVAPLVRPMLQKWQPLLDPTLWLDVAAMLKNTMDDGSATSPYAALINDTVVPAVKASGWKVKDPEGMLRFLEPWEDMLPPSTMQRILEEVVMPELRAHVDSWDSRSGWDTTCCHPKLCPWVPLAGSLLEGLYATVRRKLQEGLQGWNTSSGLASNYELVSPWKALFSPATWEEFVDEIGVVPRLAQALLEVRITAPKQNDESFEKVVMKWAPLVRHDAMVELLEAYFFDRWQKALRHCLVSAYRPRAEAIEWCKGWKRLFTPELLADERVLARLEEGIDMVNRLSDGEEIL